MCLFEECGLQIHEFEASKRTNLSTYTRQKYNDDIEDEPASIHHGIQSDLHKTTSAIYRSGENENELQPMDIKTNVLFIAATSTAAMRKVCTANNVDDGIAAVSIASTQLNYINDCEIADAGVHHGANVNPAATVTRWTLLSLLKHHLIKPIHYCLLILWVILNENIQFIDRNYDAKIKCCVNAEVSEHNKHTNNLNIDNILSHKNIIYSKNKNNNINQRHQSLVQVICYRSGAAIIEYKIILLSCVNCLNSLCDKLRARIDYWLRRVKECIVVLVAAVPARPLHLNRPAAAAGDTTNSVSTSHSQQPSNIYPFHSKYGRNILQDHSASHRHLFRHHRCHRCCCLYRYHQVHCRQPISTYHQRGHNGKRTKCPEKNDTVVKPTAVVDISTTIASTTIFTIMMEATVALITTTTSPTAITSPITIPNDESCRMLLFNSANSSRQKQSRLPKTTATTSAIGSSSCIKHTNRFFKRGFCCFFLVILTCAPFISATLQNPKYSANVVKTKYGHLRGIIVRANPTVEAYLGVPYATPPVGSLRYMPPVTPSTWKSTRLADHFSPVCPQTPPVPPTGPEALLEIPRERLAQLRRLLPLLTNQSEDCLYLNLYVPRADDEGGFIDGKPLATVVYVHGESYEWNSGNPYDGSILAAHGNVIVVTINFRLGVLGFLKTGAKGSAQGNFGLMDLVAGLHWLRENLPAFNGDPTKITLMGHSTGAALVNILTVSPVASDLVSRAILISGSALSPWAIQRDPLHVKRKVAERTGCHGDLVEDDLAPCLRTRPISELLSVKIETPRFLPGFAPFVDGTVIVNPASSTSPLTLPTGSSIASTAGIEMADFSERELLFGVTSIESYLDLSAQDLEFGLNETRRDRILRTYIRNVYHYHLNEIYSALKNEYTDWERPPRNPMGSRDAALELLSDGHTTAPLVRLGYLHSLRGGRSYFVHFKHQSAERDFPQRSGSVRGEDVPFCLGLPVSPLFPYNYTKLDIRISRTLIQYLSNFAHTGNPNETPVTSVDISHPLNHNHIATLPGERNVKLSLTDDNNNNNSNQKQKRQTNNNTINNMNRYGRNKKNNNFRRKKRNRDHNDNGHIADDSDERDETEIVDRMESAERATQHGNHNDRLDDTGTLHMPFWDTYDAINQLYLQVGNKVEVRNHYRGHKLSMWLSLIPQLHSPGDLNELSMRHHHFLEESAQYYDGIVRPQTMLKPNLPKQTVTTTIAPRTEVSVASSSTTDCPPNSTIVPSIAATRPQQNQVANTISVNAHNNDSNNNSLRRMASSQYQSYTTALTITIVVGCFLLLLNIVIFAGIYYQREKRANDAKRKEELTETEGNCSPDINDKCSEARRKASLKNVTGFNSTGSFGEYSCYDEKAVCKEKCALADICSVELPMQKFQSALMGGPGSNTNNLRLSTAPLGERIASTMNTNTSTAATQVNAINLMNPSHSSSMLYPPIYSSPNSSSLSEADSSNGGSTGLATYHHFHNQASNTTEQCHQATQADIPDVHDVGTTVMEHEVDANLRGDSDNSISVPKALPPPRSMPFQGGILRQQGGPTTPSSSKKRVQIQEISV